MSNLLVQHPEDGMLLRYIDGELPGRKARQVRHHLEACWQCRTELEELQNTVANCVRYRKNVLEAHLPAPPEPWQDLHREFDRIDASMGAESWIFSALRFLGSPLVRRTAAIGMAGLVLACGLYYQFHETPSVHAATLLNRAVLASDARPHASRLLQVRTRTRQIRRTVGGRQTSAMLASAAPVQALFEAAHYSWEDPLNPRSYQAWRDGVSNKKDEVTTVPDPQSPEQSCYRIRTTTGEGELAEASLILRTTDLQPVQGRLEFRNREWVELTDITDATTRDDGVPVATNVEPPVRQAEPSRLAAAPSGISASISDELQVFAALHGIGADLGDPVEVDLSGGKVLVSGVGIPADRQKQIHALLGGMPRVQVQFSEPAAAPPSAEPAMPDTAPGSAPPPSIQRQLERHLGGQAEFERFSSQVLDRNETLMSRAYALRRLAQKVSASDEAGLDPKDRQVLRDMAREHANQLAREIAGLQRTLNPVLISLGGSTANRPVAANSAWQPAAEDLFRTSSRVEVLVSALLGVAQADGSPDRVPSELLTAIGQLRANLEQCQQLLAR